MGSVEFVPNTNLRPQPLIVLTPAYPCHKMSIHPDYLTRPPLMPGALEYFVRPKTKPIPSGQALAGVPKYSRSRLPSTGVTNDHAINGEILFSLPLHPPAPSNNHHHSCQAQTSSRTRQGALACNNRSPFTTLTWRWMIPRYPRRATQRRRPKRL